MKTYRVKVNGKVFEVELEAVSESNATIAAPTKEEAAPAPVVSGGANNIVAPIGGKVLDVKVNVGDTVKKGQIVAVIEAMKLENEVPSPFDGKVASVKIAKGSNVNTNDVLIVLA